ncbi:MAG TPA: NAD-dependent epimerase/dehydratase family protein [Chthoniobacterales bacterium]
MAEILIAGCGFLGEAAAALFLEAGWKVHGLTASEKSADALGERGVIAHAGDLTQLPSVAALRQKIGRMEAVIHCASSGRRGEPAYRAVYESGMRHLGAMFPEARLLFVSSTSVYGQVNGEWVHEESPAEPSRETSRILLAAEQVALRTDGWVARVAGIYGPGRSVYLRRFLSGEAVLENGGSRWVNQIHRDDAARGLFQLIQTRAPAGVYNVSDDAPCSLKEIYSWLGGYFGKPLPPEGEGDPNRKRALTNKRVRNAKLRSTGWQPRYPSYREAIAELERWQNETGFPD